MSRCLIVQHVEPEGPYAVGDALRAAGVALDVRRPFVGEAVPSSAAALDGVVVMGGPMSAGSDEGFPSRTAEIALLRDALERGVPTMGICLGAQLLALAAGGSTFGGTAGPEIGWGPVRLSEAAASDPLLVGLPARLTVLHWHGDTFELPPGGVHLAANERYANQAFRLGEKAWGFQFHWEVDQQAVTAFLEAFGDQARTAGSDPAAVDAASPASLARLASARTRMAARFADLVERFDRAADLVELGLSGRVSARPPSATGVIDDRFLGALHLRTLRARGFAHDPAVEHTAFQAGTLDALMQGKFDGDATIGDILAHGDLGIGTVRHLGGELIVLDGEAYVADGDGRVTVVDRATTTPFAVVCRFSPSSITTVEDLQGLGALTGAVDERADGRSPVVAVRMDGVFDALRLRSVHAQRPPYVTLSEVTEHQRQWEVARSTGSLVGFRFPDRAAGVEVPGYHLHFVSADRTSGGHVLDASVNAASLALDAADDLHLEVPAGVELGTPGAADRAAIRAVEGGRPPA